MDAIPGALGGTGDHIVEVYVQNPDVPYPEDVDAQTGFAGMTAVDYIHIMGMVDKAGQIRAGIIIDKNNTSATTGFLVAAYTRLTNISITNSGARSANLKQGVRGEVEGVQLDRVFVYGFKSSANNAVLGIRIGYGSVLKNCIVTDMSAGGGGGVGQGYNLRPSGVNIGVSKVYFCVCNNIGGTTNRGIINSSNGTIFTNCISVGSTPGVNAGCFISFSGVGPVVTRCFSEDPTVDDWGGVGNEINKDPINDIKFTDIAADSENIRITDAASVANGAGIAIPSVPLDFLGNTRTSPNTYVGVHDLGAEPDGGGDHKGILRGVGVGVYRGVA